MTENAFENFKKSWLEEIAKIQRSAIDSDGTDSIYLDFRKDKFDLLTTMNEEDFTRELWLDVETLESKLVVALETARSRYRTENPNWWDRLAESFGRIVQLLTRFNPAQPQAPSWKPSEV